MAVIQTNYITKEFSGSNKAVDAINLEVKEGKIYGFVRRTKVELSCKPFIIGMQEANTNLAVYGQNGESATPNMMCLLANNGIDKTLTGGLDSSHNM